MKILYSDIISSVVFMTILITLGIQASTTKLVARRLNLLEEEDGEGKLPCKYRDIMV